MLRTAYKSKGEKKQEKEKLSTIKYWFRAITTKRITSYWAIILAKSTTKSSGRSLVIGVDDRVCKIYKVSGAWGKT